MNFDFFLVGLYILSSVCIFLGFRSREKGFKEEIRILNIEIAAYADLVDKDEDVIRTGNDVIARQEEVIRRYEALTKV